MAKFRKFMLKADHTYHAGDAQLPVTPARLKHWESQFKAMTDKGIEIPIGWDHSADPAKQMPIYLPAGKKRSAKDGAGKLANFEVGPDGKHAILTFDVRGKQNIERVEANIPQASPIVWKDLTSWKDGDGGEWNDVITCVDLVRQGVDHRQTPFEKVDDEQMVACSIAMGIPDGPPQVFRMQSDDEEGTADAKRKAITNGNDEDDENTEADATDGNETDAVGDDGGQGRLKTVIDALAAMNVVLSGDTNSGNFLEHLEQALLTAAAMGGEGDMSNGETAAANGDVQLAQPQVAALSLENKRMNDFLSGNHRVGVTASLDACLEQGRCSPAEHAEHVKDVPAIMLSLDDQGNHQLSAVEQFVEHRKQVPEGTFWDDKTRTAKMAADTVPHPSHVTDPKDVPETKAEANVIAREFLKKPPLKPAAVS